MLVFNLLIVSELLQTLIICKEKRAGCFALKSRKHDALNAFPKSFQIS
jgi:hypothetical protein